MIKKPSLPALVAIDTPVHEPVTWFMPSGTAYVSTLSVPEMLRHDCVSCPFVARTADGVLIAAFEFFSDAVIELTANGYDIKWDVNAQLWPVQHRYH